MEQQNEQNRTMFSSVLVIALILLFHIVLIVGLIGAVILFKGIYDLRWWILAGGLLLIGASAYFFYRRVKAGKRRLRDMMNDPAFHNRNLEISLLGGMATLRVGHPDHPPNQPRMIDVSPDSAVKQLPAPSSRKIAELSELNHMLEQGLITKEEFLRLKEDIL
ncbi:MAG: SHOCT domain-containing protein [Pelovirga sp.]